MGVMGMFGVTWAAVSSNIGALSGLLFVIQLIAQIHYYGLKQWVREGMGVGVTRDIAEEEVEEETKE